MCSVKFGIKKVHPLKNQSTELTIRHDQTVLWHRAVLWRQTVWGVSSV